MPPLGQFGPRNAPATRGPPRRGCRTEPGLVRSAPRGLRDPPGPSRALCCLPGGPGPGSVRLRSDRFLVALNRGNSASREHRGHDLCSRCSVRHPFLMIALGAPEPRVEHASGGFWLGTLVLPGHHARLGRRAAARRGAPLGGRFLLPRGIAARWLARLVTFLGGGDEPALPGREPLSHRHWTRRPRDCRDPGRGTRGVPVAANLGALTMSDVTTAAPAYRILGSPGEGTAAATGTSSFVRSRARGPRSRRALRLRGPSH